MTSIPVDTRSTGADLVPDCLVRRSGFRESAFTN